MDSQDSVNNLQPQHSMSQGSKPMAQQKPQEMGNNQYFQPQMNPQQNRNSNDQYNNYMNGGNNNNNNQQ